MQETDTSDSLGPSAEPPPEAPQASRPLSRRHLIGAGGVAGLGGAIGLGYWLREQQRTGLALDASQQAGHLLRRAGFAPTAAEVSAAAKAGLGATTDRLLHPERVDDSSLDQKLTGMALDLTLVPQLREWWLTRMTLSKRPLLEKMTLFWHGLLTSSFRKQGKTYSLMATQNKFLRDHALGNLRDMLVGITKDGMMLKWLDGVANNRIHPNENYARELMELFTMGVGNYTETDVREGARALTGWFVDASGTVSFRPRAFDSGSKTFLGRTGNFGLEDVIDIILAHPATPKHTATKLWEFFVYPGPSDADLRPVIDAYHSSKYDIRAMVAAIFNSPAFYTPKAYRGLVKSPTELIVGLNRQFGLALSPRLVAAGETMGQALLDPPNVAGWPGGPDWLSTGGWMARMRFLLYQSAAQQTALLADLRSHGVSDHNAAIDHMVSVMVDGSLTPAALQSIREHVTSQAGGSGLSGAAVADALFLVASTPEYQLA
ncbi:MAG TPA: DUF1800 domain-containing protein [Candidatus Solibacter sp.]|jgi:uncharacterized protein (DUF1800 family)|nr:DUF1800 domain-containing protein [Candidatus Solibacter sp.]